jgi:hypothetical protein
MSNTMFLTDVGTHACDAAAAPSAAQEVQCVRPANPFLPATCSKRHSDMSHSRDPICPSTTPVLLPDLMDLHGVTLLLALASRVFTPIECSLQPLRQVLLLDPTLIHASSAFRNDWRLRLKATCRVRKVLPAVSLRALPGNGGDAGCPVVRWSCA